MAGLIGQTSFIGSALMTMFGSIQPHASLWSDSSGEWHANVSVIPRDTGGCADPTRRLSGSSLANEAVLC